MHLNDWEWGGVRAIEGVFGINLIVIILFI